MFKCCAVHLWTCPYFSNSSSIEFCWVLLMKNCTMIVFFLNAKFGIPETFTHFYLLSALFRFTDFFHAKGNRCAGNPLQNLNVRFISFPTPLPSFLFCLFVLLYYFSTIILSLFLSFFFPFEIRGFSNFSSESNQDFQR